MHTLFTVMKTKWISGLVGFPIAALLVACAPAPAMNAEVPADYVGQQAPEIRTGEVSLRELEQEVVVVSFFNARCEPCAAELTELEGLRRHYGDDGLRVIAVAEDEASDGDELARFTRAHAVGFPVAWDSSHAIARSYRPGSLPWSYVIDRHGVVRFGHAGFRSGDRSALEEEVRTLLAEAL